MPQGQRQQVAVGGPVAQQGKENLRQVPTQVHPLLFYKQVLVKPQHGGVHILKPVPHAKKKDILQRAAVGGLFADIVHPLAQGALLFPVRKSPPGAPPRAEGTQHSRTGGDEDQRRVQAQEQKQIHAKPQQVLGDLRQHAPDGFPRGAVGVQRHHSPLFLFFEVRPAHMGVGGPQRFEGEPHHQRHPQLHPAVHSVFVPVGQQPPQQSQCAGHHGDGTEQFPQGRGGFHFAQRQGRQVQFRQADSHVEQGQRQAEPQHAFVFLPCQADHIPGVLPHIVGWFLGLLHADVHLFAFSLPQQKVPGGFRGRNVTFGGRTASVHPWGSKISVVKAPSSLLRLRYPPRRCTTASMRSSPNPWPSPLVVAKRPAAFFCLPPGARLVKEM